MSTVKHLEEQVNKLSQHVSRLQTSNSELRDELLVVKKNYNVLVKEMSTRLEVIQKKFRNEK